MTTEIKIGLWIASLVAVLGILFGAYHYGRTAQKMADDNAHNIEQIAIAKVIQNQAAANDALKTQLGVQHEKDTAALDALRNQPAVSVRIPTCTSAYRKGFSTGRSVAQDAADQRASDRSQAILDDATKRLESKSFEWSAALNACKVTMSWAQAQAPSK
jgi:hypothetical protein